MSRHFDGSRCFFATQVEDAKGDSSKSRICRAKISADHGNAHVATTLKIHHIVVRFNVTSKSANVASTSSDLAQSSSNLTLFPNARYPPEPASVLHSEQRDVSAEGSPAEGCSRSGRFPIPAHASCRRSKADVAEAALHVYALGKRYARNPNSAALPHVEIRRRDLGRVRPTPRIVMQLRRSARELPGRSAAADWHRHGGVTAHTECDMLFMT